jgi:hypothetical protein
MEVCVNRFLTIFVEQKNRRFLVPEIMRSLLDQLQQVTALQLVALRDLVNDPSWGGDSLDGLERAFRCLVHGVGWPPRGKWDGVAFGINMILPRFLVDICEIWFQEPI